MALGLRCSKSISSIPSDTLDILLNRCYARGALIILWEEDTFYLLKFWGYSYKHTRTNPYILRSPFWRAKPVFEDKQLCFSHLTFVLQEMLSLAWALFLLPFMWTHEISWTVGNFRQLLNYILYMGDCVPLPTSSGGTFALAKLKGWLLQLCFLMSL
jgi:hypothetical protein